VGGDAGCVGRGSVIAAVEFFETLAARDTASLRKLHQVAGTASAPEALPLSLLNDFLYCPRRAALKVLEGLRS
jgi:hypothetical protein